MGFFCTLRVRICHDFKTVSDVDARQSIARINYLAFYAPVDDGTQLSLFRSIHPECLQSSSVLEAGLKRLPRRLGLPWNVK